MLAATTAFKKKRRNSSRVSEEKECEQDKIDHVAILPTTKEIREVLPAAANCVDVGRK